MKLTYFAERNSLRGINLFVLVDGSVRNDDRPVVLLVLHKFMDVAGVHHLLMVKPSRHRRVSPQLQMVELLHFQTSWHYYDV